jgi:hypothetical protein
MGPEESRHSVLLTDGFAWTAELRTFPDDVLVTKGGQAYAAPHGSASGANAAARAYSL